MTSERTIVSELTRLADLVGGKAWGAEKMKPRIYMPSRRDCKVYFQFEDAVYPAGGADAPIDRVICGLFGASLQVFIDDCGQHPNWYKGQREKILRANFKASLAIQAAVCEDEDPGLGGEIMEMEEVTGEQLDEAGAHLANGRVHAARAALGL